MILCNGLVSVIVFANISLTTFSFFFAQSILISPSDSAYALSESTVNFSWNEISNSQENYLQVDTSFNFENPIEFQVSFTDTSIAFTEGNYFWEN